MLGAVVLVSTAGMAQAGGEAGPEPEEPLRRPEVLATARAVADWQLENLPERAPRAGGRGQRITGRSWIRCVLFTGVVAAYRATGEERYLEAALELGEENRWRLGPRAEHADDHCVGQVYGELYLLRREEQMIAATRERFDRLLASRRKEPLWSWSDALFMAPPAAALLSAATGERRYLDWMSSSWRQAEAALYDRRQRLWYRDLESVPAGGAPEPGRVGGSPVFWGRGNGWVMAGAARLLAHMPPEYPHRAGFERLLREMAARMVEIQGEDGLWRASLLDPVGYPRPEASASALITFALAAGVNQGLLGDEYRGPVGRAWRGLGRLVDDGVGSAACNRSAAGRRRRRLPTRPSTASAPCCSPPSR